MPVDTVLKKLSPLFNELYEEFGRPSIPPEQLLKSRILMALHSVRSERLFCEQLGYNLLWLWFLRRGVSDGRFDYNEFIKENRKVFTSDVAKCFKSEVYELFRRHAWARNAHFTADIKVIDSWVVKNS